MPIEREQFDFILNRQGLLEKFIWCNPGWRSMGTISRDDPDYVAACYPANCGQTRAKEPNIEKAAASIAVLVDEFTQRGWNDEGRADFAKVIKRRLSRFWPITTAAGPSGDEAELRENYMRQWDEIRAMLERMPGSDLPRLKFEDLLDELLEKRHLSAPGRDPLRDVAIKVLGDFNALSPNSDAVRNATIRAALEEIASGLSAGDPYEIANRALGRASNAVGEEK